MPAYRRRAQRALDDVPGPVEEDESDDHPRDETERHLDDAVAQLTDVIHERHAAIGVVLSLRLHEALADDAGTRDCSREFRHDLVRRLAGPSWTAGCAAGPGLRPACGPGPAPWWPHAAGRGSAAAARRSAPATGQAAGWRQSPRAAGKRRRHRRQPGDPDCLRRSRPRAGPELPSSGCASTDQANAPREAASWTRTAR